jgi:hypothetical protein
MMHAEECKVVFDAGRGLCRIDVLDERDLPALMKLNQIPDGELMNVSRSASLVIWPTGLARWSPLAHVLSIEPRSQPLEQHNPTILETPIESGCPTDKIFDKPLLSILRVPRFENSWLMPPGWFLRLWTGRFGLG